MAAADGASANEKARSVPGGQPDLGGLRPGRDPGRGPDFDPSFEGRGAEVGQTDPELVAFDRRFEPDPVPEEVLQEDAVEKEHLQGVAVGRRAHHPAGRQDPDGPPAEDGPPHLIPAEPPSLLREEDHRRPAALP
ncbi:MAG: hypothetical protein MZV64_63870 [Ignavibacteriales bacterium]|nr:hypothetical protein [Ignavibacteriales bacterium]